MAKEAQINSPEPEFDPAGNRSAAKQFGIAALFWITFLVGLGISYLQRQDMPFVMEGGIIAIMIGLVVGLVGWESGPSPRLGGGVAMNLLIFLPFFFSSCPSFRFKKWEAVLCLMLISKCNDSVNNYKQTPVQSCS